MKIVRESPIINIVGFSGAGKTSLLEKLIPEFTRRGFRVGTIKHDVHGFEIDQPGKDSWRHKQAGASTTIISSSRKVGIIMDVDHDHHPDELASLLSNVDIILAEGYKQVDKPKLEVFRPGVHKEPLLKDDENLVALISDMAVNLDVPQFSMNDIEGLTDFLITYFGLIPAVPIQQQEAAT